MIVYQDDKLKQRMNIEGCYALYGDAKLRKRPDQSHILPNITAYIPVGFPRPPYSPDLALFDLFSEDEIMMLEDPRFRVVDEKNI